MKWISMFSISIYNLLVFCIFFLMPSMFFTPFITAICALIGVNFLYKRLFRNSNASTDFEELHTQKIICYLLNLDRSADRLNFVLPKISALDFPFERVSATDGDELSQEKINSITDIETYKKFFKMFPENGTIGCSLSHEKVWRKFLDSDNEFALIFEDDVVFDQKELSETVQSAVEKRNLWDVIGFELNHHGNPKKIITMNNEKSLVVYLTNVKHSGCYLINRKAANKLLEKFYPIKMPLDHYFTAAWEFDIKFVGIEPRLVKQSFGNSQIKTAKAERIRSIDILAANAIYNIQRAVINIIYNFCYFLFYR